MQPERPIVDVSIIIPSFNMAGLLNLGLASLRGATEVPGLRSQIIVVDDGSADDTRAVAEAARRSLPQLHYLHRPRDERSCRALARNTGIAAATGDFLIFLDAGVVFEPDFVQRAVAAHRASPGDVFVYEILGLFAWREGVVEPLGSQAVDQLAARLDQLAADPVWQDRRVPLFELVDGDLSRLPAPWLLAWTGALGVPRDRAAAVGGFDEDFRNWGGEDCDFAWRVARTGARLRSVALRTLHVPHPTEPLAKRGAEHEINIRKLHRKADLRETELYLTLQDPMSVNLMCRRLDELDARDALPGWSPAAIGALTRVVDAASPRVLVGAGGLDRVAHLGWSSLVVHREAERAALAPALRAIARVGLGCRFVAGDQALGTLVIADLFRLLPRAIQVAQLQDAVRVAQQVFLAFNREPVLGRAQFRRELAGWPWLALETLPELARAASVRITEIDAGASASLRLFCVAGGQ